MSYIGLGRAVAIIATYLFLHTQLIASVDLYEALALDFPSNIMVFAGIS